MLISGYLTLALIIVFLLGISISLGKLNEQEEEYRRKYGK